MQRDRGLAGARAPLHDEAAVERRPDHLVLLGRDGGDDVAHLRAARAFQLGQQRIWYAAGEQVPSGSVKSSSRMSTSSRPSRLKRRRRAEALRVSDRRPVEGGADGRPPVDDQGAAVVGLDVAAPDVPLVAGLLVDASEAEVGSLVLQGGETVLEQTAGYDRVDLGGGELGDLERSRCAGAHGGQSGLCAVEVRLLDGYVRVRHRGRRP